MDFISLLGLELTNPVIAKLLEKYDVKVVYDYDRNNENIEDEYWAPIYAIGAQFQFDQNKRMKNIFLYIKQAEGFRAIDKSELEFDVFTTMEEAETHFAEKNIKFVKNKNGAKLLKNTRWIKGEYDNYLVHYQFDEKELSRITLIRKPPEYG